MGDGDVKRKSTLLPGQEKLLKKLTDVFLQGIEQIPPELFTEGFPTFTEEAPGLSPLEKLSLAGLEARAAGQGGAQPTEVAKSGAKAIQQLLGGQSPAGFEEFFKETVQDPLVEALTREGGVLDALRARGTSTGNRFGAPIKKMEARSTEDLIDALARERARLRFATEQANIENKLRALSLVPGIEETLTQLPALIDLLGIQSGAALLQAGSVPRRVEELQRQSRLQNFLNTLAERNLRLGMATPLATTGTVQAVQEGPGFGQAFAQGLGGGIGKGLGGGLSSAGAGFGKFLMAGI